MESFVERKMVESKERIVGKCTVRLLSKEPKGA